MLRDNALTFYRDQDYDIPQKPVENRQYINTNSFLAVILKICKILDETTWFISETVSDRAKQSLFSTTVGLLPFEMTTFENIDFWSHDPSRSHDLGNVNWLLSRKPLEIE